MVQGSRRHIRALLGATGGVVKKLRRKDRRLDLWRVRVRPSSHAAVTVTLSPSPACGETGAVCTADGRTFTTGLATRIQGPPGLAVADAEVEEAANATLAFAVTLSRPPSSTVTVDYATSDGTAVAGSDYTATSGTLTFAAGETDKTVSVPVLDDAHDEGSETLTLVLLAGGRDRRRRLRRALGPDGADALRRPRGCAQPGRRRDYGAAGRSAGNLASASAEVTRLRLGLEGSWPLALGDDALGKGATVTPRLALGVRHDGGDAETGFGADIGGGVALAAPAHGLTVSLEGRGVLTHEAAGLRDRGVAGTFSWNPPLSDRGPKLTLTQTLGSGASGGKDALLSRTTLEGLAANDNGAGRRRLEARFGYGFSAFGGGFAMTPEIGFGLSEAGRDYSLGWRLTRTGSGPGSLELSIEARRRESANDDTPPEHGIAFRATARW